jgi:hypothetical protein
MERASVLLGHSSIKVTEKHYSPWVGPRQEQLEADVRRSWNADLSNTIDPEQARSARALLASQVHK